MKIKVSITDDQIIVLSGLKAMLHNHPRIELLQVCMDGKELMDSLLHQQPEVLLLDVQMPGLHGDQLTKIISKKYPDIKIIALTNMDTPYYLKSMLKNGASGYLLKNAGMHTLTQAIIEVYEGKVYIEASLKQKLNQEESLDNSSIRTPNLTKREHEILNLIADELTSAQIAKKLFITIGTVENHRINLFLKLGVKNVVGLVRKSTQLGLIK